MYTLVIPGPGAGTIFESNGKRLYFLSEKAGLLFWEYIRKIAKEGQEDPGPMIVVKIPPQNHVGDVYIFCGTCQQWQGTETVY